MGVEKLARALANLPDPPCVGCPHYTHCATSLEACEQFDLYVLSRSKVAISRASRQPCAALYQRIFSNAQKRGPSRVTTEQFESMKSDIRPAAEIASEHGVSVPYVYHVRARAAAAKRGSNSANVTCHAVL